MNKRIQKKKNRIPKIKIHELSQLNISDQIDYFIARNIKKPPQGYLHIWEAAYYKRRKSCYKMPPEEWLKVEKELYGETLL